MLSWLSSLIVSAVVVLVLLLPTFGHAQEQIVISSQQLYDGMQAGIYNAVIDVRTFSEWENVGHIENATLVESLSTTTNLADVEIIFGCENCTVAVYCRSGARATGAIRRLRNEFGFMGTLYNAGGTNDWTDAGFPLIPGTFTSSVTPECSDMNPISPEGACPRQATETPGPTPPTTMTMSEEPSSSPVESTMEMSEEPSSSPVMVPVGGDSCGELYSNCEDDDDCCDGAICKERLIGPPVVKLCVSQYVRLRAKTSVGSTNRGGRAGRAKAGNGS